MGAFFLAWIATRIVFYWPALLPPVDNHDITGQSSFVQDVIDKSSAPSHGAFTDSIHGSQWNNVELQRMFDEAVDAGLLFENVRLLRDANPNRRAWNNYGLRVDQLLQFYDTWDELDLHEELAFNGGRSFKESMSAAGRILPKFSPRPAHSIPKASTKSASLLHVQNSLSIDDLDGTVTKLSRHYEHRLFVCPSITRESQSPESNPNAAESSASTAQPETSDPGSKPYDTPLMAIWDDEEHIVKSIVDGIPIWKCKWCGKEHKHWNAVKALAYVSKIFGSGTHVLLCKGHIPPEYLAWYRQLTKSKTDKKKANKQAAEEVQDSIAETRERITDERIAKKSKITDEDVVDLVGSRGQQRTMHCYDGVLPLSQGQHSTSHGQKTSTVHAANEANCDTAIAQMIHGLNLPLNLGQQPLFIAMVKATRLTGRDYIPPKRGAVGGDLLDTHYNEIRGQNDERLTKEADVYGM